MAPPDNIMKIKTMKIMNRNNPINLQNISIQIYRDFNYNFYQNLFINFSAYDKYRQNKICYQHISVPSTRYQFKLCNNSNI